MQVKSHHMQDLQLVGFFVNMGSFRFCFALSTRAHGVPFLHTSGAHLTTPFHGAIAVGAMLPPTPPSIRLHSLVKHIQKKHPFVWRFGFFDVNLRQQFTAEKRTRAPLTFSRVKSAVCKEGFYPSLTSPV